jgi:hypothetical protein
VNMYMHTYIHTYIYIYIYIYTHGHDFILQAGFFNFLFFKYIFLKDT